MLDSFTGGPVFDQPAKDDQLDQTQTVLQKMRSNCIAACYDGWVRTKWSHVTIIKYALLKITDKHILTIDVLATLK